MKRLYRDRWDRKVGGVLGGLGQYLNIDPTLLRLAYVFLAILTGLLPLIVAYLIAWLIMPDGPKLFVKPKYKKLYRSRKNRKISGICGGLATFTKIDATLLRICLVVACLMTGVFPLIFAYFAGMLIIPETVIEKK